VPSVICHREVPRLVHGACHAVTLIMSGQMIFRPAAHMPVNSLHCAQKPSRMATMSDVTKPQSGQVQPVAGRPQRRRLDPPDALTDVREAF
jgi:hypothetical protein